ncbi:MAG: adenosine deaminase [Candidatus Kariarchaeaceae archaeon]
MEIPSEVRELPKVELHRHFEGCITPEFLGKFVKRHYPEHRFNVQAEIDQLFDYSTMEGFLGAWIQVIPLLSKEEHFTELADHVVNQFREENIIYADIIFSPQPFFLEGLSTHRIFRNIYSVFKQAGITTHIIVDQVRNFGVQVANSYLDELIKIRNEDPELADWIVAISIGGDEKNYPPELFIEVFTRARENGLRAYAHAGEWAGPENVWTALKDLKVERIGHGTQSFQDPTLMDYLRDNTICLDVSISSNYFTGAVDYGNEHPVRKFIEHGLRISLNTDDPGYFFTDLNLEYAKFLEMGYSIEDLQNIVRNAIESSFATEREKFQIKSQLD